MNSTLNIWQLLLFYSILMIPIVLLRMLGIHDLVKKIAGGCGSHDCAIKADQGVSKLSICTKQSMA